MLEREPPGTRVPISAYRRCQTTTIAAIIPKKEAAATTKKLSALITADLDRGCHDLLAALFLYF
jgi:hypothetical protein